MGLDFFVSIISLIAAILFGLRLTAHNLKTRQETLEERMALYRQRKRLKNQALARRYGVELPEEFRKEEFRPESSAQ